MRILAVAWLMKGLAGWATILGAPIPDVTAFDEEAAPRQALTIVFAVLDPIAAVGLWLTVSWGGFVWIFAAMSWSLAEALAPSSGGAAPRIVVSGLLVVAYLVVSWLAAREPESRESSKP